jgi:hypothetical protein
MGEDVSNHLNKNAEATNKLLAASNSVAFVAWIHFIASKPDHFDSGQLAINPAICFSIGLTCIILTAAFNYFAPLYYMYNKKASIYHHVFFWGANLFATLSGIFFFIGLWTIALNI